MRPTNNPPDSRSRVLALCASVPWWKRWFICHVLSRRKWQLARAHNIVASSMLLTDDHQTGMIVRAAADRLWNEIYSRHERA